MWVWLPLRVVLPHEHHGKLKIGDILVVVDGRAVGSMCLPSRSVCPADKTSTVAFHCADDGHRGLDAMKQINGKHLNGTFVSFSCSPLCAFHL